MCSLQFDILTEISKHRKFINITWHFPVNKCDLWIGFTLHSEPDRSLYLEVRKNAVGVCESYWTWHILTFIIRNVPQRCMTGITFIFTFTETSFNPALCKTASKDFCCNLEYFSSRSVSFITALVNGTWISSPFALYLYYVLGQVT